MYSLFQQCLENFGSFSYVDDFRLTPAEAAKYTMESGAFLIEMESLNALNEVYEADYAVEAEMVRAVAEAKRLGIPVEEGLKEFGSTVKSKVSDVWGKVKDWFKKMKEKVKAWFENVKRVFRSMFSKPIDFVKRYKSDIESVDGSDIAASIKMYRYTNIDGYLGKLTSFQTKLTDKLLKEVEYGIRTADDMREYAKNWAESKQNGDPNQALIGKDPYKDAKSDNENRSIKINVIKEDIEDEITKEFGAPSDRSKKLFAYFRGGASDESDKVIPKSLSMSEQVKYVLDTDAAIKEVTTMQNTVDNTYKKIISSVETWSTKHSKASRISPLLSTFTSTAGTIQTGLNDATNAYVTAAKERAAAAYQICKKAMSYKHKVDSKK